MTERLILNISRTCKIISYGKGKDIYSIHVSVLDLEVPPLLPEVGVLYRRAELTAVNINCTRAINFPEPSLEICVAQTKAFNLLVGKKLDSFFEDLTGSGDSKISKCL